MTIGYAVARLAADGKVERLYALIGQTPEEGMALLVAARIEYPHSFSNAIVVKLESEATSASE